MDFGTNLLSGVLIYDSEVLKDLNLPLSSQVLVSEKHNAAFVHQCSKIVKLLASELT
jgi:hypothetical protein